MLESSTAHSSFLSLLKHPMDDSEIATQRLSAMAVIFSISLLAVSFPAISKKTTFFTIPKLVFFVGKHFGTGVILSTAFCHLLQDSFEALTSKLVKDRYPEVGDQTGLIILTSLILIFLVEYISTSYVDYLHEEPSAPPSPAQSRSRAGSIHLEPHSTDPSPSKLPNLASSENIDEHTALLSSSVHSHDSHIPRAGQQQHYLSSILTNNPRHSRSTDCFYIINDLNFHLNNGEYHLVGGKGKCVCVCVCPASKHAEDNQPERGRSKLVVQSIQEEQRASNSSHDDDEPERPRIGRKRQIVGILVLQLGIMIHSLVIGLTLAITSGTEFTSLVTAIIFHQLFEGLSLGIRIAGLPPVTDTSSEGTLPYHTSSRSSSSSSKYGFGARPRSIWSRITHCISFRRRSHDSTPKKGDWLQPILSFLFAITTPAGMGLGMLVFSSHGGRTSEARMMLTQGLMSAISAGMLIYAATVEMMAGDFVFGNLGGHGSGGHHDSHGEESTEGGDQDSDHSDSVEGVTPGRRALAVVSLLAGVAGMGLIGLGE